MSDLPRCSRNQWLVKQTARSATIDDFVSVRRMIEQYAVNTTQPPRPSVALPFNQSLSLVEITQILNPESPTRKLIWEIRGKRVIQAICDLIKIPSAVRIASSSAGPEH